MKNSELQSLIETLPRALQPQRDLWPDINTRLKERETPTSVTDVAPHWRKSLMAASILLALTGGIFIGRGMNTSPADQSAQSLSEFALGGTVEATEREYQAAFRELIPLDYSGLRLNGEEPGALQGSWDDLVRTEADLLAALRQYPSDIYLNEKLLDLRSKQLQFVKRLALLEQNDWRTT